MEEQANKIQAVINTLQDLDIKPSYGNMDKMLGCLQTLVQIRDSLKEVKTDGNAEAE